MTNAVDMLNNEVMVTTMDGRSFTGTMVDINESGNVAWIDCNDDWRPIDLTVDRMSLVHPIKEEEETPAPHSIRTIKELKALIKEELSQYWYEEIESVKVAVYNTEEDGAEVYDCEVQMVLDSGDTLYPTFGTYYDEKQALKAAREMRTKLKRTYDISEQVFVYTC